MDPAEKVQLSRPAQGLRLGGGQGLQDALLLRQWLLPLLPAQVLVEKVLGDLAQPGGDLAAPVKAIRRPHRLVEGLLGQLLRQSIVMALGEEKLVHRPSMGPVNFLHVLHGFSPPLFVHTSPAGAVRYTPGKNIFPGQQKRDPGGGPFFDGAAS